MPTVQRIQGFRFFFFSNERQEPPHIHVQAGENYAKFWLDPVVCAASVGFAGPELTRLRRMVQEHADDFQERWNEFFNR